MFALRPALISPVLLPMKAAGVTVAEANTSAGLMPASWMASNSSWKEKPGTMTGTFASVPARMSTPCSSIASNRMCCASA